MDINEKILQLLAADPCTQIGVEVSFGLTKKLNIRIYADDYLVASVDVDSIKTIFI